jgi:hypothetical protein
LSQKGIDDITKVTITELGKLQTKHERSWIYTKERFKKN